MPRKAMPGGPLGTLPKLGKNTAAYLSLGKQNSHLENNTYNYIKVAHREMKVG